MNAAFNKVSDTIAFFSSVIKSGEGWTEHCVKARREAGKGLAKLMALLQRGKE